MVGCLFAIAGMLFPRILLIVGAIASLWDGAWQGLLWPILGWIFLPYTTLVFGCQYYFTGTHDWTPMWIIALVVAVFFDIGSTGSAAR